MMTKSAVISLTLLLAGCATTPPQQPAEHASAPAHVAQTAPVSPDQALKQLTDGNARLRL